MQNCPGKAIAFRKHLLQEMFVSSADNSLSETLTTMLRRRQDFSTEFAKMLELQRSRGSFAKVLFIFRQQAPLLCKLPIKCWDKNQSILKFPSGNL